MTAKYYLGNFLYSLRCIFHNKNTQTLVKKLLGTIYRRDVEIHSRSGNIIKIKMNKRNQVLWGYREYNYSLEIKEDFEEQEEM